MGFLRLFIGYVLFVACVSAFTADVVMESCYDTTRRGYGFRITNGPIVSKVNCTMYFEAPSSELYFAVRLNRISLAKIGNSCPTFTVYEFSSWRLDTVPDKWKGSEVLVPTDPAVLVTCNCSTYKEKCSNLEFFETRTENLKIMLSYNPDDGQRTVKRENAFDVTLSSFKRGASFTCPNGYFLCWHYKYRCLPESLVCDGIDSCFDNSDEYDFACTGRIRDMTLPAFVLMIMGCVIGFCAIVWIVTIIVRRRMAYQKLERNEWGEVVKSGGQFPQQQSLPQDYAASEQYPAESLPREFDESARMMSIGSQQQQQQAFA